MTNSNLVAVFNGTIQNQSIKLCNARELHTFLEIKDMFAHWIKDRINEYGFVENEDYIIVTERTLGRPRKEYHITLDMGKELGMVERNEKGRQIRQYFIRCEKAILQNQQQNLPLIEEKKFTFEFTQSELQDFCWLWFEAFRMNQLLKEIYPALDALGSRFAPEIYSMGVEYGNHINYLTARIHRLVKDVNFGDQTKPFEVLQQVLTKPRTKLNYNRRNF